MMSPPMSPTMHIPPEVLAGRRSSYISFPITPPAFDDDESIESAKVSREILKIHEELAATQKDLRPRRRVNELFTRLVTLCIEPHPKDVVKSVMENKQIKSIASDLRRLCSDGEYALELHWTMKILCEEPDSIEKVRNKLLAFPYYNNYVDLCRLEMNSLKGVSVTSPRSIAFLGSGPLPLTSFGLADCFPKAHIHNIDHDADAIRLSCALAYRLGYGDRITFAKESATDESSLDSFDVVYLAALVGLSEPEKMSILQDVGRRMRPGALLCVRSAHSLRQLLYPALNLSGGLRSHGLELVLEVHPWNHIVNSTIILRVARK